MVISFGVMRSGGEVVGWFVLKEILNTLEIR